MALSYTKFLQTLPEQITPHLPAHLQKIKVRQPWRWLLQLHFGEPNLHYEVSRATGRPGLELGFHFEARDHKLNLYLLTGFRRHLFEIKDMLGESIEAEMWDRGWTKVYEVFPAADYSMEYQQQVGRRMAEIITCLHPIYVTLRQDVARTYR